MRVFVRSSGVILKARICPVGSGRWPCAGGCPGAAGFSSSTCWMVSASSPAAACFSVTSSVCRRELATSSSVIMRDSRSTFAAESMMISEFVCG